MRGRTRPRRTSGRSRPRGREGESRAGRAGRRARCPDPAMREQGRRRVARATRCTRRGARRGRGLRPASASRREASGALRRASRSRARAVRATCARPCRRREGAGREAGLRSPSARSRKRSPQRREDKAGWSCAPSPNAPCVAEWSAGATSRNDDGESGDFQFALSDLSASGALGCRRAPPRPARRAPARHGALLELQLHGGQVRAHARVGAACVLLGPVRDRRAPLLRLHLRARGKPRRPAEGRRLHDRRGPLRDLAEPALLRLRRQADDGRDGGAHVRDAPDLRRADLLGVPAGAPPPAALAATVISFSGVALVAAGASSGLSGDLGGVLLGLAASATWALYSAAMGPLMRRYSPYRISAFMGLVGSVPLLLTAVVQIQEQDWEALGGLAWACF